MTLEITKQVDDLIAKVDASTSESQLVLIREMVNTDAALTQRKFVQAADGDHIEADHRHSLLERRTSELTAALHSVEKQLPSTANASRLCAAISAVGATACLVSEANLGLSIPYVLNVPPHSISGILMGVAMACSALILDLAAQKLQLTVSPWELLHKIPNQILRSTVQGVLVCFLIGVSAISVLSVLNVVPVREEAMKVQHRIENAQEESGGELNEDRIRLALEWYSIAVVLGAALLTTSAVSEIRMLARRRALRRERNVLKKEGKQTEEQLSAAAASQAKANLERDVAGEKGQRAADLVRDERLVLLERAKEKKPDVMEFVSSRLSLAG